MSSHRLRRHVPILAGGALLLVLAAAVWFGLSKMLNGGEPQTKKMVQQISLIKPPPPPPPKVEEKPPEPKVKEEVKVNEPPPPKQDNQQPPPGKDLGVDADGNGNGDGFGLVGRKGGRDLLSGDRFGWYASQVKATVTAALMRDDEIRKAAYSTEVTLWLGPHGEIQRCELKHSTGDDRLDAQLKRAIVAIGRVAESDEPPPGRTVTLRLTSRI